MLPGVMGRPMDVPLKSRLISLLAVVLGGSAAKSLHTALRVVDPCKGSVAVRSLG